MVNESDRDQQGKVLHPLFDESSLYRLGTRESIWNDGGWRSVVALFDTFKRSANDEQWSLLDPDEIPIQDWGYPDVINEAIHRVRQSAAERVRAGAERPLPGPVERVQYRAPRVVKPTLVLVEFDATGGIRELRALEEPSPKARFTNMGSLSTEEQRSFKLDVSFASQLGEESSADDYASRRCLALILTQDVVLRLARVFDGRLSDERDEIQIIRDTLQPAVLARSRVAGMLALAPGIEGITDNLGRFQRRVDFRGSRPPLEPSTWVVTCLGPKCPF